jgi:VWFA-related protein
MHSAAFAVLALLQAQTAPATLLTVEVAFVNAAGSAVRDVRPEELAIVENGVARDLAKAALDERPLSVLLIVDSSQPVTSAFRLNVVEAVAGFLAALPPGTRYALWTTGDRPTRLVDWTDDRGPARGALRRVFPQGGNTLLDALVEATDELKPVEGTRSAVVVVTGMGVGFASQSRQAVVDRVKGRADVFYGVEYDQGPTGVAAGADSVGRIDYEYVLSNLASASGGRFDLALSPMGVDKTLARVAGELGGLYRLSYATLPDLKQRKLEVTVARPELTARVLRTPQDGAE